MTENGDDGDTAALQVRIEQVLLGGRRKYTRHEVAEHAGVALERMQRRWRGLGFAGVDDDAAVFTDADVASAILADELFGSGLIEGEMEGAVTRALGHHLSRLAEWQVDLVRSWAAAAGDNAEVAQVIEATVPVIERVQTYVWRRHLAAYAGRVLAADGDTELSDQAVGFVDMVGYTRMTRQIDEIQLSALLDRFEQLASDVIADQPGRIVKTIGDEVLFVADTAADAAEIAAHLNDRADDDPEIPELRTGLAFGRVLSRMGDVYGAVVNIAARLTSIARPGTVLVDERFAAELDGDAWHLRSLRPASVRGYRKLRSYVLRPA